jgi:hypothetical protein
MASHVDLVGILFIVWGGLTMLIGVSTLALGAGALALLGSASRGGGGRVAATITAAMFITIAVITILWGLVHVILGMSLRRQRHWSRVVALVLAAVDTLLLPYGTALGVYAMWVLLSEKGKAAFRHSAV